MPEHIRTSERPPAPLPSGAARPVHRVLRRGVGLGGLAFGLLLLASPPAAGHDQLVESEPAADAQLDTPPDAVVLRYSAELLDISATVLVTGPTGAVAVTDPVVVGTEVTTSLPPDLPPGAYLVVWRVVSSDGHPIQGTVPFVVRGPEPEPSTPTVPEPVPATPDVVATTDPDPGASSPPSARHLPLIAGTATGALALLTAAVVVGERRSRRRDRSDPSGDPR